MAVKTINDAGTSITLHKAGDATFVFRFWSDSNQTTQIDIGDAAVEFVVKGLNPITLAAHPDQPLSRILILTAEFAQSLGSAEREFYIRTVGSKRQVIQTGKIKAAGFAA